MVARKTDQPRSVFSYSGSDIFQQGSYHRKPPFRRFSGWTRSILVFIGKRRLWDNNIHRDQSHVSIGAYFVIRNLTIGTKLMGSFLLIAILSVLVTSYVEFRIASKAQEEQVLRDLALTADSIEGALLEYLDGTKKRVVDFSSDGFIRDSVNELSVGEGEDVASKLRNHLIVNKKSLDPSIFRITVMDRNGIVVGSTDDRESGLDRSGEDYFLSVRELNYGEVRFHFIAEMEQKLIGEGIPHLIVSAPLTDRETGAPIGVISNHIRLNDLNDVLLGKRKLSLGATTGTRGRGESFEAYLVSENKVMITESRFIKGASLKQKVDTLPVRKCEIKEEISGVWPDYRGISVVGASTCLQNGWTLLSEIDEEEAFALLADLRRNVIYLIALMLVLSALYASFLTKRFVSPIMSLLVAVQNMIKGDFSHKAEAESQDEIGQLALSFNEMAEKLQAHIHNLETSRTTAEKEKTKLEVLMSGIGDGMFAVDREQAITHFNRVAEELSGYTAPEALGKPYYEILKFIKEKDGSENTEFIRLAMRGEKADMDAETVLIKKDGSKLPVADSAAPVKDKDGNIHGVIVVFRDETQEREIRRMQEEIISLTSHQLKTPLSIIKGSAELLQGREVDNEVKKLVDVMGKTSRSMIALVENLLSVSKIEQGKIDFKAEPFQIEILIDGLVQDLAPIAQARNVNVDVIKPSQPLHEIRADQKYLKEALKNIISNAIDYTKDKVTVELKDQDNALLFTCADNGIGIPRDEQSKVFEKFYRSSNAIKVNASGTGLGMSISKAVIEKLGGRIWFESEENQGTTFYVSLPF